jgi:phage terminase large subunit-like protein
VRVREPRGFVPAFEGQVCSLGYQVIDWIEAFCCHGPGDVQGQPIRLDDEWFDFIVAAYALDPVTGKRRIDRAMLSRPKGRAKSELAGFVVVAEALAPVRFDGWDAAGQPVARPVTSPLIKCLATEESQAGNTFENAAFIAGEWGKDVHPEIYAGVSGARQYQSATALYLPHGGELRACTAGSASKDGGKETFVVPDETHLYVLRELKSMYATVARNTGKRSIAEPWMDLPRLYRTMRDPQECEDDATAARYFLNRPLSTKDAWIPTDVVERQARTEVVEPGEEIALGFDGSLNDDSTVLIGSRMADGFLFPVGIWAKPSGPEGNWWEVPRSDVLASIREAFARYKVTRLYADPHEWRSDIDALADEFGDQVAAWETRRDVQMAAALDRLHIDLRAGTLFHSGDPVVVEHFGNAYVRRKGGHRLVRKEHDQSPRKIDAVVGAALAYEARADVLAAGPVKKGLTRVTGRASVY